MGLKGLDFNDDLEMLFKAVLELKNIDECYKFFEDIATITELKAISQRIQVANMLKEKKVYTEIAEATGASTATISRVNKCLNYGQGGYNIVLDRINTKNKY
ncbi:MULTISPECIES: YerC/YecD family TrpR-related protein [unclassified Clostridium]|jgi:TrpR-related protein YerC/YecD|uniref:YerC/YecD family TrpR-related protein n=1 Tax=Clostridium TaxID=1485 RepID=UPI001C8CC980|nr:MULTISPECIES: YerC/YecD family TrpR-related protein [unclassified Clostridium]MBX9137075.1 TrpR-like protein YerC/YecD [Clostridium sp. K12(2020)]MBX9143836.1 TrpR-like protein YerC/YecD [Clostridium sp. K13]MDU2288625.1 YerC/YecD family TrpR-related protein [Clostridium celatum]MDU4325212.1 YerC/YecD family TrpR-related protein [Clostridium celatum]